MKRSFRNLCLHKLPLHNLLVVGLISSFFVVPTTLSAASGCTTSQLSGVYNAQVTNAAFMGVLSVPPTTTSATVLGFASNPSSLSGSLPGLGRYFFDGTGNIIGITAATATSPTINTNVGTYTVSTDCSGSVKLTSGAAYDIYISSGGSQVQGANQAVYVRTDANGGGESGVLRPGGSCVTLNYPGSFVFQVSGGTKQTPTGGTAAFYAYSTAGTLSLDGSGNFNLSESQYNLTGASKSTATGTYTVGGDCSVTLRFSTATGANSANFTAPTSFRFLMVDATTGLLAVQPDSTTTLTGTLVAQ